MRDHAKLRAFELADQVAVMIYMLTRDFPKEEIYGMTSQMRRAAVSVASNIVEGCARESQMEYHRFLDISFGSLKELGYQLSLSKRLGFIKNKDITECETLILETEKVLGSLLRSMRKTDI
ncbi:MAG: four helix bundle protein [Deltaproteobacteria bacterium]|nr:four helix bundle protein [Deltaproteobacteria bacterium]